MQCAMYGENQVQLITHPTQSPPKVLLQSIDSVYLGKVDISVFNMQKCDKLSKNMFSLFHYGVLCVDEWEM